MESGDPEDKIQHENGDPRKDPETRDRVELIAKANEDWRDTVERRIKTAIRWAFFGVGVAMATAIFTAIQWQNTASKSDDNSRALCAWRSSLEVQVASGKKLLKKHPDGLPGIATAEEIAADTANRQRVVVNFRYLDCS